MIVVKDDSKRFENSAKNDKFLPVIKLVIREVAERAGFRNALDLSKRANLPYESVRRLWQGTSSMVSLATLDRICQTLEVRPAQLFDYEPDAVTADQDTKKKEASGKKSKS
jgi:DNA-binding Xre family transcriptional regulator